MALLNCWSCWRGSHQVVKRKGNIDGTVEQLKLLKGFLDGGKQERDYWKNPFNNINSSTAPDKILSFSVLYLITPSTASTVQQYHYQSLSLLPPSQNPFNSFNCSTVPLTFPFFVTTFWERLQQLQQFNSTINIPFIYYHRLRTPSTASTVQQYHWHSLSFIPPYENPFNSSTVPLTFPFFYTTVWEPLQQLQQFNSIPNNWRGC